MQSYCFLLITILCIACKGQNGIAPSADYKIETVNQINFSPHLTNSDLLLTNDAPHSITRTVIQDGKGNIWLASWEGVFKYDGKTFTNVTKGLSLGRFFSVLEDRKGNFWLASVGSGVYYYDGQSFQNFTTEEGLVHDSVTNIYEDRAGRIWFSTEGGMSCYDGQSFKNYTTEEGLPHNRVNSVLEDQTGKFWIGTVGSACTFDGKSFNILLNEQGEHFENVRDIVKDKADHIWLGGNDGLWRYDGEMFKNLTRDFVGYIYEDNAGDIWTSSENRITRAWELSRYDINATTKSSTVIKSEKDMLFGILKAANEQIWVGSLKGVFRYDL